MPAETPSTSRTWVAYVLYDFTAFPTFIYGLFVTSWDKISRMSQFFHMEFNIPVFIPHPVLHIGETM